MLIIPLEDTTETRTAAMSRENADRRTKWDTTLYFFEHLAN
jgi:hypothetical protein